MGINKQVAEAAAVAGKFPLLLLLPLPLVTLASTQFDKKDIENILVNFLILGANPHYHAKMNYLILFRYCYLHLLIKCSATLPIRKKVSYLII